LARIAETDKDWAAAEKNWLSIYDHFPKTYLAPIALQNAAVAAEERGANDAAIAHYKLVIDKYSGKTVGIPHALFAVGRLSEESKDYPAAATSYAKLLSTYPDDDWTKLAKDRIIFLKTRGLSK
jgi:TolA-binding protein